jgi:hypothetical protein
LFFTEPILSGIDLQPPPFRFNLWDGCGSKSEIVLFVLLLAGALGAIYLLRYPYFVLPGGDIRFIARASSRVTILQRFERINEELGPGESFQMTGWYPLPDRKVTGSAFSVVRRYGSKIYFFFDSSVRLEEYFIATS